jgi:hypothetical protein
MLDADLGLVLEWSTVSMPRLESFNLDADDEVVAGMDEDARGELSLYVFMFLGVR